MIMIFIIGQIVDNKTLKVSYARPGAVMTPANIYVAGLPKLYSKTDLEQTFLPYGSIIETKILFGMLDFPFSFSFSFSFLFFFFSFLRISANKIYHIKI